MNGQNVNNPCTMTLSNGQGVAPGFFPAILRLSQLGSGDELTAAPRELLSSSPSQTQLITNRRCIEEVHTATAAEAETIEEAAQTGAPEHNPRASSPTASGIAIAILVCPPSILKSKRRARTKVGGSTLAKSRTDAVSFSGTTMQSPGRKRRC